MSKLRVLHDLGGLSLMKLVQLAAKFRPRTGQDAHREQSGVFGSRFANGERAHGDAARHLYDGQHLIRIPQAQSMP